MVGQVKPLKLQNFTNPFGRAILRRLCGFLPCATLEYAGRDLGSRHRRRSVAFDVCVGLPFSGKTTIVAGKQVQVTQALFNASTASTTAAGDFRHRSLTTFVERKTA